MHSARTISRDRRHAIDPAISLIGVRSPDVPHRFDPAALTCTSTRYTLLERIARGATSTVHRAIEHRVDGGAREVALKRLAPLLAEDTGFLGAFIGEAAAAARLRHPNIATISKVGRGATGYFIASELVGGHDVCQIAARLSCLGLRLPLGVALALLRELCEALAYAHSARVPVVHGDLSPHHLRVDRRGRLKVTDFGVGLAQPADELSRMRLRRRRSPYASPEALAGERPTEASDIFSVGVVGYELVTGKAPFRDEAARGARLEPPSALRSDCPRSVDGLIMRALQRRPTARFASAAAMRNEIVGLDDGELRDAHAAAVARTVTTLFGERHE